MKQILFLAILSTIFTNCLETDINYEFPFEQKTVALGFVDSVNGARVYIGKNIPVLSRDSSGAIKTTEVSLWENDHPIETLHHFEKNVFVSSTGFKILPQKTYFFKASTPLSIDTIISEKITILPTIRIENVRYKYVGTSMDRVNLYVDMTDPKGYNAYAISVQRFRKDTLFGDVIQNNPLFVPINGRIFNDREFEGQKHSFLIENVKIEEYQNKRFIPIDKIRITLFNLSQPCYETFLSLNTPEPSAGDPFFEPTIIKNTVKNGIGMLGTYSSHSFDIYF